MVLMLECGLGMVYVSKVEPIELADGKWLVKEEVYAGLYPWVLGGRWTMK